MYHWFTIVVWKLQTYHKKPGRVTLIYKLYGYVPL